MRGKSYYLLALPHGLHVHQNLAWKPIRSTRSLSVPLWKCCRPLRSCAPASYIRSTYCRDIHRCIAFISTMDDDRSSRNEKLFKKIELIVRGKEKITKLNYSTFLEAICIYPDPPTCVSKLVSSPYGLSNLQSAMRLDLSHAFCNGRGTEVIRYLTCPELAVIGGGEFLRRVLLAIVEPPFFWSCYVSAFRAGKLHETSQRPFAWLLLQLLSLPDAQSDTYLELTKDGSLIDALLRSSQHDVRVIGERIKHVVDVYSSGDALDTQGPGGRHDNDKVNFREISILPTADEISSQEPPFLRTSSFDDPDTQDGRIGDYLDNQFRLLREDMIYEMREELDIARGLKRKNYRNFPIDGLRLMKVHHQSSEPSKTASRQEKWSVSLQRMYDFPQFKHMPPDAKKRKKWLVENRGFLKHGSMVCILVNEELVTFATLRREEDLLALKHPVIVLQLEGEATTIRALLRLKFATTIKLLQIDAAFFAFEPVLKALQQMTTLPLAQELLFWSRSIPVVSHTISSLAASIISDPSQNLQPLLGTSKPIHLDKSQSASLVAGLSQPVSLIQGPPGGCFFER
jgi:hypothetical protein